MKHNPYLTDMPSDIMNYHGLSKTLLTRRETIYVKHVLKNIMHYKGEEYLNEKLDMLNFKSQFSYFTFMTDKLRGIYKYPREYSVDNVNDIVKVNKDSFIVTLEIYKEACPLIILDFDKTITNPKFHSLYEYLINAGYDFVINSANPSLETIEKYLDKHELKKPIIYANKGKKSKLVNLKTLAMKNTKRPIFYIDDELEYLEYGTILFMHTYLYTKQGKIKSRTIFEK